MEYDIDTENMCGTGTLSDEGDGRGLHLYSDGFVFPFKGSETDQLVLLQTRMSPDFNMIFLVGTALTPSRISTRMSVLSFSST